MRRVEYDPSARRDLAKLAPHDANAVLSALDAYAANGVGDVKKLQGRRPAAWRLRVGRHRVLYRIEGSAIVVTAVGDRRDVYR